MKELFFIALIFHSFFCFSQNAPSRIGDYNIGISTASEFKTNISYKASTISNDDELSIAETAPNDEYAGNIWIHPVSVDYLSRFPGRKELFFYQ